MNYLPKGFRAAGISRHDRPRPSRHGLALFYSEVPAVTAACYTTNQVKCAHITVDQKQLRSGMSQAILVNSGCANCCTGARGLRDAEKTIVWASHALKIPASQVLVASTGVIGDFMPMELLSEEIPLVSDRALSSDGTHHASFSKAAQAIMTTDTVLKEASAVIKLKGKEVRIWGCCKGAGMIHPQMTATGQDRRRKAEDGRQKKGVLKGKHATMLAFIFTDADIQLTDLKKMMEGSTETSFNRVTVDGDMSTNDTVFLQANGASGVSVRTKSELASFQAALDHVCQTLSKKIAKDGEGASKFLEIRVEGSRSTSEAQQIAMTVATSPLVKTAAYGEDSNWGRILAAIGRSGVSVDSKTIAIYFGTLCVFRNGAPTAVSAQAAREPLKQKDVVIRITLGQGKAVGFYWTCDFTGQYVDINARYRT